MLLLLFWFPSLLLLMCQLVSKQILLMTSSLHKTLHRPKSIHLDLIVPPGPKLESFTYSEIIRLKLIFIKFKYKKCVLICHMTATTLTMHGMAWHDNKVF